MSKLFTILFTILIALFLLPGRVSAMMHVDSSQVESHNDTHESLDEVLPKLLTKYDKNTIQELDCKELTDKELERVGDAVMESMHPGVAHERMDEIIGGKGSESLRKMHIQMGQRYFDCDSTGFVGGGMGMSGFANMMGTKALGYQRPLANNARLGGLHTILAVTTWIAFITFLVAGTRWFWKKSNQK